MIGVTHRDVKEQELTETCIGPVVWVAPVRQGLDQPNNCDTEEYHELQEIKFLLLTCLSFLAEYFHSVCLENMPQK